MKKSWTRVTGRKNVCLLNKSYKTLSMISGVSSKKCLEDNYQQTTTENETLSQEIKVLQQKAQNFQRNISGQNKLKEKM